MRDEETGSFWQQSGGRRLQAAEGCEAQPGCQDELTFGLWKKERRTARPGASERDAAKYEKATWRARLRSCPL